VLVWSVIVFPFFSKMKPPKRAAKFPFRFACAALRG